MDKFTAIIHDISFAGQGVTRCERKTVFVNNTTLGDEAEIEITEDKGNYFLGKLVRMVKPSPKRVAPKCRHFGSCGGCQLQNLSYPDQLAYKENVIRQTVTRVGALNAEIVRPIIGADDPWSYRNKAQIPFGVDEEGNCLMGFFKPDSHEIVNMEECSIQDPDYLAVANGIKEFMQKNSITIYDEKKHSGLLRHIVIRHSEYCKEMLVGIVINGMSFPESEGLVACVEKINKTLKKYKITSLVLNCNKDKTNRVMNLKNIDLMGSGFITEKVGKYFFKVSLNTFLQVYTAQADKAYDHIIQRIPENSSLVLDLYCGVGTITLNAAEKAQKIIGIEENRQSIKDAKRNAVNNGIKNVEFIRGAAEYLPLESYGKPDVVILDPPRKGLAEGVIRWLKNVQPKKIIYMSCSPTTLARDLKLLSELYKVESITPFDFFPQTVHVESIADCTLR